MIKLSIQNFILFLLLHPPHPAPIPFRTGGYQRKGGTETKQKPVELSWIQKLLCVVHLLFVDLKCFPLLDLP